jgi:hypothetical protein
MLQLRHKTQACGNDHAAAILFPKKEPQYPLDRKLLRSVWMGNRRTLPSVSTELQHADRLLSINYYSLPTKEEILEKTLLWSHIVLENVTLAYNLTSLFIRASWKAYSIFFQYWALQLVYKYAQRSLQCLTKLLTSFSRAYFLSEA